MSSAAHPDRQRPGEKLHTYDVPCHEPLVFLAFLGAVTTRLELATSIVISTQRQTVLLAKQAAELDLLTGGRLRLGVGIGRNWMEYEALGAGLHEPRPADRGTGRGAAPAVDPGAGHVRRPLAPSRPHRHQPPAGATPDPDLDGIVRRQPRREGPRAHRSAGGRLDAAVPPGEQLADALERLRGYAAAAGRDPERIGIECGMRIGTDDDPQNVDRHRRSASRALGATHLRVSTMGGGYTTPDEHLAACDSLARRRRTSRPELTSGDIMTTVPSPTRSNEC